MQYVDIPLYENSADGINGGEERACLRPLRFIDRVERPCVSVYFADKPNGTAVVVCPGGGYRGVSIDKEGLDFARYFAYWGITTLVLTYRLPGGVFRDPPLPLQDARRALEIASEHASDWKIKPEKIGIMGFSAGGHLALMAGSEPGTKAEFLVLGYPVVSFRAPLAHGGSRDNLIGAEAPAELVDRYSLELRNHRKTPPTFIVHSDDDPSVPVGNSVALAEALSRAGSSCEFVRHPTGGHGYGMGPAHGFATAPDWTPRLYCWLKDRGLAD